MRVVRLNDIVSAGTIVKSFVGEEFVFSSLDISHDLEQSFIFPAIAVVDATELRFPLQRMVFGTKSFLEFIEKGAEMIIGPD